MTDPRRFRDTFIALLLVASTIAMAHEGPLPLSLKGVPVPEVPGLLDGPNPIVIDKQKAIVLGKALFWDVNVGSDGQACASCHFHAGADRRIKNQLAPTGQGKALTVGNFELGVDANTRGANYPLRRGDFPFIQANRPLEEVALYGYLRQSDDVAGSAGTFGGKFKTVELLEDPVDGCERTPDAIFHARGVGARRVTQRNAPTVINAAFNHRNFWDGRANNVFNGSSPWGDRDPNAGVWIKQANGSLVKQRLRLINSSLASQAVAPLVDSTEMSCSGRVFADIGRKLMWRHPLENQKVHWNDSVLGAHAYSTANTLKTGLKPYYFTLVRQAFNPIYWSSNQRGPFGAPKANHPEERPLPYNQYEANFGMFFALAIQLYESTLVSDDSPFDRSARDGDGNPVDLTPAQLRGMNAFRNAHCNQCHAGPTFSTAAIQPIAAMVKANPAVFGDLAFASSPTGNVVMRSPTAKGNGFIDTGFASTTVVGDDWDPGLAGNDPFGNPLAFAPQYMRLLAGESSAVVDSVVHEVRACDLGSPIARNLPAASAVFFTRVDGIQTQSQSAEGCVAPAAAFVPTPQAAAAELAKPASRKMLTSIDGSFKIPTLRNVELTGPYMHNGGMATLEEVVEFYTRGGNFDGASKKIDFIFPQTDLIDAPGTRSDIVEFLKSLTDDRVRYERAPFDHPELPVPHGHAGDHLDTLAGNPLGAGLGKDQVMLIPAVGAEGLGTPLAPFVDFLGD
jgi:cytochrome c peroxidase